MGCPIFQQDNHPPTTQAALISTAQTCHYLKMTFRLLLMHNREVKWQVVQDGLAP
jgi:hypothetical protein